MPGGMFELRRDDITGWWVAVVVDREFDRSRFARRAEPVGNPTLRQLCRPAGRRGAPGSSSRTPSRSPAPSVTHGKRATAATAATATGSRARPASAWSATSGSWQTIVAPPQHHGALAAEEPAIVVEMLVRARDEIIAAREAAQT